PPRPRTPASSGPSGRPSRSSRPPAARRPRTANGEVLKQTAVKSRHGLVTVSSGLRWRIADGRLFDHATGKERPLAVTAAEKDLLYLGPFSADERLVGGWIETDDQRDQSKRAYAVWEVATSRRLLRIGGAEGVYS